MLIISGRSVNELYHSGMAVLKDRGQLENSRNGEVYVCPYPVITHWSDPSRRVLIDEKRRANHAFHLNEAIWMLRGESYAPPLDRFVHDFSSRFAEPSGHLHGAYGLRWRKWFGVDQIEKVIDILIRDSTSRQAVIQMWSAKEDLGADVKDKPCNTQLMFRIHHLCLDMTVCNRSNDIIWGLYGANAVHFSILHEYLASRIGIGLGTMYTVSNNFHAYKSLFDVMYDPDPDGWYDKNDPIPLVNEDPALFMKDVNNWDYGTSYGGFKTRWFNEVAIPVTKAFLYRQYKEYDKMVVALDEIQDMNYYYGMRQWCRKGLEAHEAGRQV